MWLEHAVGGRAATNGAPVAGVRRGDDLVAGAVVSGPLRIIARADDQPLYGIVIVMFFDDHGYPHFHARHAEGEAKVRIDNLEVTDSTLPRRQLRFVLAWAELHQDELSENWRRARAGATPREIEPLR